MTIATTAHDTWDELDRVARTAPPSTFDGVTIPSAGRAGLHFGTDRWDEGMFFRFEITSCQPIAALHPPSR